MTEILKSQVILAIDLTEASGVVSLVKGGTEIAFTYLLKEKEVENLPQVCLKILEVSRCQIDDIRAFAVSENSYSLTRGRIVKSLIRGMADGFDIPVFELNLFKVLLKKFHSSDCEAILFGYLPEDGKIQFKYFDNSNEIFDKTLDDQKSVEQLCENEAGEKLNEPRVKTIVSYKLAQYIQVKEGERKKFPEKFEILEVSLAGLLGQGA